MLNEQQPSHHVARGKQIMRQEKYLPLDVSNGLSVCTNDHI